MTFLVEGSHGPVSVDEGVALAHQVRAHLAGLLAAGTVSAAWAKGGGGRVLVVEAADRAEVDAVLAAFPGPASTTWEVAEVHDYVTALDAYLASVADTTG